MYDFDAAEMPVSDLIGDQLVTVAPTASLGDVARTLDDKGVGAIGVSDGAAVVGVISERDIVRAMARGLDPVATTADDVAHKELVWADPAATVLDVAEEMMEQWIRHVLVGTPTDVVGMVSARDLLAVFTANADADLADD